MTARQPDQPVVPLRESFPAFYRREYPKMVAVAAAVSGNRGIAEDLAQEAMIRAHRHWDRISTYERPGAWVRRATINLALSASKRGSLEVQKLLRLGRPATLPEPEVMDETIFTAVAKLPGKQRAAIALHYLEDRSIEEIASILEISSSTARVHLHRGRQTLADRLGPEEVST